MFKIGIIDDEAYAREALLGVIDKSLINAKLEYRVYQFESASTLFKSENLDYDLLFLDIEMGEENGVEISKMMRERGMKPIIVFVTSYDGYIKDAFGLNIYGYVMKDEIEERIPMIMNRIVTDLQNTSYIILQNEFGPATYRFSDIVYFMIEDRKCYVKTVKELSQFYATSLKEVKASLNEQFLQPNAKYIVNAQHIKTIENGAVILSEKTCIFISRGKFKKFDDAYKEYLIHEVHI